jgi:hypothetical protein
MSAAKFRVQVFENRRAWKNTETSGMVALKTENPRVGSSILSLATIISARVLEMRAVNSEISCRLSALLAASINLAARSPY